MHENRFKALKNTAFTLEYEQGFLCYRAQKTQKGHNLIIFSFLLKIWSAFRGLKCSFKTQLLYIRRVTLLSEQWGQLMVTHDPIAGFVIDFSVYFSFAAAVLFQMLPTVAQLRYLYHSCTKKITNGEESANRTGTFPDLPPPPDNKYPRPASAELALQTTLIRPVTSPQQPKDCI